METWTIPVDFIPPSMLIEFLSGLSGLVVTKERIGWAIEAHQILNRMSYYRLTICIEPDGRFYVVLDPPADLSCT